MRNTDDQDSRKWNWTMSLFNDPLTTPSTPAPPAKPSPLPQKPNVPPVHTDLSTPHPEVWENPYYPLPGPPSTPAEKAQLQQLIMTEKAATTAGITASVRRSDLKLAVKRNCADVQHDYMTCFLKGTVWEKWTLCSDRKSKVEGCESEQQRLLEQLGYERKGLSERERAIIADQADELYLKGEAERVKAANAAAAGAEQAK
ncbi:hypothetical protein DFS34DRAFT_594537 [Phlyctochytrium arcticum]|nr:hypothetical protein DFS34DRAFT_594537 [Phlyctochytrium arcticum]